MNVWSVKCRCVVHTVKAETSLVHLGWANHADLAIVFNGEKVSNPSIHYFLVE